MTRDVHARSLRGRRRGVAVVAALIVALYAAALALIGIGDAASALTDASAGWLAAALVPAATGVIALSTALPGARVIGSDVSLSLWMLSRYRGLKARRSLTAHRRTT